VSPADLRDRIAAILDDVSLAWDAASDLEHEDGVAPTVQDSLRSVGVTLGDACSALDALLDTVPPGEE